jgi:hypothetical protein
VVSISVRSSINQASDAAAAGGKERLGVAAQFAVYSGPIYKYSVRRWYHLSEYVPRPRCIAVAHYDYQPSSTLTARLLSIRNLKLGIPSTRKFQFLEVLLDQECKSRTCHGVSRSTRSIEIECNATNEKARIDPRCGRGSRNPAGAMSRDRDDLTKMQR